LSFGRESGKGWQVPFGALVAGFVLLLAKPGFLALLGMTLSK